MKLTKRVFVLMFFLAVLSVSFVYGVEFERINIGGGRYINFIFSTTYQDLERYVQEEWGLRINIGGSSWAQDTNTDAIPSQVRNLLRQYSQQGVYNSYAMAIFVNDNNDVDVINLHRCYRDRSTSNYIYTSTYFEF